jgi:hypothetical protein
MLLIRSFCAQQKVAISVDLLGLHSAQNFISRLPHVVQTHHKADKWKSLRYQHLHCPTHRTANHRNTSLSPVDSKVCAIAGRERSCSQDPERPHPHPCRHCPQTWTPRRVKPAPRHRVRNLQIPPPPQLHVLGGQLCRATSKKQSCIPAMFGSTFREPLSSTKSSPAHHRARTMSTIPRTFGCQTTRRS